LIATDEENLHLYRNGGKIFFKKNVLFTVGNGIKNVIALGVAHGKYVISVHRNCIKVIV